MSDAVPETEIRETQIPETAIPAAEIAVAEAEAVAVAVVEPEYDPGAPEYDPGAPAPLSVPRTPTGHADVDAQLERLGDADHLATDGHIEVYEDVHRGLRDALTALDARPGPPAPSPSYGHRS